MPDITPTFSALDLDYIAKLNQLVAQANAALGLRLTQAQVDARIAAIAELLSGLSADLNANGYRITGSGNAINPGDLCNLATVQALISGGGTPASIPITSLGVGTVADGQIVMRIGGAIVGGLSKSSLDRAIRQARLAAVST